MRIDSHGMPLYTSRSGDCCRGSWFAVFFKDAEEHEFRCVLLPRAGCELWTVCCVRQIRDRSAKITCRRWHSASGERRVQRTSTLVPYEYTASAIRQRDIYTLSRYATDRLVEATDRLVDATDRLVDATDRLVDAADRLVEAADLLACAVESANLSDLPRICGPAEWLYLPEVGDTVAGQMELQPL